MYYEIKEPLLSFLKKENLLKKFMDNINVPDAGYTIEINDVCDAFVWDKTEEGHQYWLDVQNKFDKECHENDSWITRTKK
jgi:hypothetical protein